MINKVGISLLNLISYAQVMASEMESFSYNIESEKIAVSRYHKLNPKIQHIPLQQSSNEVILEQQLLRYIVLPVKIYDHLPVVLGGNNENQVVFSLGDTVYLKDYDGISGHQQTFISKSKDLVDPDTNEFLGSEYSINATGIVSSVVDNLASVNILSTNKQVSVGDKLITIENQSLNITPHYSNIFIDGKIIAIHDLFVSATMMDSVVINKGSLDGVKVGLLFNIMDNITLKNLASTNNPQYFALPERVVGEILIYSVYDKVSFGVIMNSDKEISLNTKVKSKINE